MLMALIMLSLHRVHEVICFGCLGMFLLPEYVHHFSLLRALSLVPNLKR